MNLIGNILLIILILLILLIILLYLGIRISLKYEKTDSKLIGSVNISILNYITIFKKEIPTKKDKIDSKKKETDSKNNKTDYKTLLKESKKILKPTIKFIKNILKCIKIYKIENHFELGLDSYVDTAKYIGYIWGINSILNTLLKPCNLTAIPIFEKPTINAKGTIDIKINVIKIIPKLIQFILIKDVRNFIKIILKERKND